MDDIEKKKDRQIAVLRAALEEITDLMIDPDNIPDDIAAQVMDIGYDALNDEGEEVEDGEEDKGYSQR